VPATTRVWIDEAYVEYAGPGESLERLAVRSENIVVCKSMSKVYALSGARAAYLCAPAPLAADLRAISPPWAVSLPAQVAAVMALQDPDYYQERYRETRLLRARLAKDLLASLDLEIVPSEANFVLCHLLERGPDAAEVCDQCRAHGLFLRDAASMSVRLGRHALRIAVKDAATNCRIVEILTRVLRGADNGARSW
jgi:histidinol-phosphate/aromatic aminotransferase/cobyric acid decarboxylase-like protein